MTARLKIPPYGKALLAERRAVKPVSVIHVNFSETWGSTGWCEHCPQRAGAGPAHPQLQVLPSEYRPFVYDWTVVTGCMVAVFDWRDDRWDASTRHFFELLGELGRYAGPVQVYHLEPERPLHGEVVAWRFQFAWDAAVMARQEDGRWPLWWPAETEALNAPRRETWWRLHDGREAAAA